MEYAKRPVGPSRGTAHPRAQNGLFPGEHDSQGTCHPHRLEPVFDRNLPKEATLTGQSIMSTKPAPLGAQEYDSLRAIARSGPASGASVTLSSTQRLRFEMLGLIEDRADGLRLTAQGREVAAGPAETAHNVREIQHPPPRDRRGLRLGLRRRSPF